MLDRLGPDRGKGEPRHCALCADRDREACLLPEGRLSQPPGGVAAGAADRAAGEDCESSVHSAGRPPCHEGDAHQGPTSTSPQLNNLKQIP